MRQSYIRRIEGTNVVALACSSSSLLCKLDLRNLTVQSKTVNMLSAEQVESFKTNGYLIVRDFLSNGEVKDLQRWAQEVHDWEATPECDFMPYEVCAYPDSHLSQKKDSGWY